MKRVMATLLMICLTSGCSMYRISSEDVGENYYQSRSSVNDIVYLESLDDKPHEVIGTVMVNAERRQYMDDVITQMKREAAVMGGDAITDIRSDATGIWKKLPAQEVIGNAYVRSNFTAKVIVFKSSESESRLIK